MKIILQLGIIFGICYVSKVIETLLPFAFPASVIGLLLLLGLLIGGRMKTGSIRETSDVLTGNLAFFLLPIVSSIMNYTELLRTTFVPFFAICIISTFVTFFAVYGTVRFVAKRMRKEEEQV